MSTKVLVVDDSMLVRQQVRRALTPAGFDVVDATDGVDALEKLKGATDTGLIVCDVNMPRMGGLEFLEQTKSHGSTVPFVMLTTEGQPEMMKRAKALGAVGWILKPFKPEHLVAAVLKLTSAT
jgi:two-component system chemotaxis response regulator CheY